jgi:hypothetical protein
MNCTPIPEVLWLGQCDPENPSPRPSMQRPCWQMSALYPMSFQPFDWW